MEKASYLLSVYFMITDKPRCLGLHILITGSQVNIVFNSTVGEGIIPRIRNWWQRWDKLHSHRPSSFLFLLSTSSVFHILCTHIHVNVCMNICIHMHPCTNIMIHVPGWYKTGAVINDTINAMTLKDSNTKMEECYSNGFVFTFWQGMKYI